MTKVLISIFVLAVAFVFVWQITSTDPTEDQVQLTATPIQTLQETITPIETITQTATPLPTQIPITVDANDLLVLVDKEHSIGDYVPSDLVALSEFGYPNRLVRSVILDDFRALWQAAQNDGISFTIPSAYRSYETQARIHQNYVDQYGAAEAKRFSAEPGHSEHQLGTTVDFGVGDSTIDFTAAFGDSLQGIWLVQHAWEYGFILSYPRNSEHITGYTFEPWHWRYVGREQSKAWQESGLTAIEFLKSRP